MAKSKSGKSSDKSKASKKGAAKKGKVPEVKDVDLNPVKSEVIGEKTIVVTVETVDNIKVQSPGNGIILQAQFGDILQRESPPLELSEEGGAKLRWEVGVPVFPSTLDGRNFIATHPVLFTILEVLSSTKENAGKKGGSPSKEKGGKKGSNKGSSPSKASKKGGSKDKGGKKGSVVSKGQKGKGSDPKQSDGKTRVLGHCNLDLISLLLGEVKLREVLLVAETVRSEVNTDENDSPKGKKKGGKESKGKGSSKGGKEKSSKSSSPPKAKPSKGKDPKSKSSKKDKSVKSSKKKSGSSVPEEIIPEVPVIPKTPTVADLARITVSVSLAEPLVAAEELDESNMLFVTLESLYNPTPAMLADTAQYMAATVVPNAYQATTDVRFGSGLGVTCCDNERTKRWIGLAKLAGKSSFSKYKMSSDILSVKNALKVDVCKAMNEDSPRIEWNLLQRYWLSSQGFEYIADFISTHRWWPLEIYISPRTPQANGKFSPDDNDTHLVAYFDMSKLLHPGVTRSRVVGQVFSFCQTDVEKRCGIKSSMLVELPPEEVPVVEEVGAGDTEVKASAKGGKKGKKDKKNAGKSESSTKSKSTAKSKSGSSVKDKKSSKGKNKGKPDKNKGKAAPEPIKYIIVPEGPYGPECLPRALTQEHGKPVFIVLELELWKPLKKKRTLEVLVRDVDKIIPIKTEVTEEVSKAKKASEEFNESIVVLTEIITFEYQKFLAQIKRSDISFNIDGDISRDFFTYLRENGIDQKMKEVVLDKVSTLLTDKLGFERYMRDHSGTCSKVKLTQKYVSDVYVILVEEMHAVINGLLEIKETQNRKNELKLTDKHEQFQEREALEMGKGSRAEKLLLRRIEKDNNNPELFLEYAIFNIKRGHLDKAMVNVLEALSWDRRNKLSLMMYAMLLSSTRDDQQAETFFELLMALYPAFLQGGVTFYLFYCKMDNEAGAEVTLERIRKSTAIHREPVTHKCLGLKPLSWCPDANPHSTMFLATAVLLLQLNELDFAGMALKEEYAHKGTSPAYLYYLSVHHYLSGQYEGAIEHLRELLSDDGRNCALWSLLGHCQYKVFDVDAAMESYQFVTESRYQRGDNHLVSLRMAEYLLEQGDYRTAKNGLLEVCRDSPSANSWLGVGIACYLLGEYGDAEKALTEANVLDSHCPITWGYLTLLNLHAYRQLAFEHCYCQAIQNKLRDEKVLDSIEDMRIERDYPAPNKLLYLKLRKSIKKNKK